MSSSGPIPIKQANPEEAWKLLEDESTAILVDVRTEPEWRFVGIPDLAPLGRQTLLCEWRRYPDMSINPGFADTIGAALGDRQDATVLFICRSGARSMEAAMHVEQTMSAQGVHLRCINVAEGFEGDLDSGRHRGSHNGWKARGLAWLQS